MDKSAEKIGYEIAGNYRHHVGFYTDDLAKDIAAAIREDRAEPVSEAAFAGAWAAYENPANKRQDRMDRLRAALEAARQARANADEKGGAR